MRQAEVDPKQFCTSAHLECACITDTSQYLYNVFTPSGSFEIILLQFAQCDVSHQRPMREMGVSGPKSALYDTMHSE